ncbi:hypothetical protein ACHAXR_009244 [Thalassiosira sp. AJA248-18]
MTSLYAGVPADDIVSPLLDKAQGGIDDDFHNGYPLDRTPSTPFEFISSGEPSVNIAGDDEAKMCCPQIFKSSLAALIAVAGAAASILCFVIYIPAPADDLIYSIFVYIMAAICLLNSCIMLRNEKKILFTLPASRSSVIDLYCTKKHLKGQINALIDEVEILDRNVARCEEAETKLRGIVEAQSFSVDDLVGLVHENEETMDLIRENLRQKVIFDVVGVIIRDHGNTQIFESVQAKLLASKIKVKVEYHGIMFEEEKFLHALAMDATFFGAISTVKKMLPGGRQPENFDSVYDMFYLPNNDQRQIGSVHAARATLDGTHMSLAPNTRQMPKQSDDWSESCSSSSTVPKRRMNRLREQLYQFRIMAFPYFRETREGRCLFGTLVILTMVNSGINVYFSFLMRDFYSALAEKEVHEFYQILYKFLLSMVVLIPLQVSFRFVRVKLGIAWRNWLTSRVMKLYFSNKVYYGLERSKSNSASGARGYKDRKKEMDNPDQRIQEDCNNFTEFSLSFFLTIVLTLFDLVSFSIILFSILPELFIAIILFASLGTFFSVLIGKVLIGLNYESLQREADFRFSLVRVRENAESIAFYGGEKLELNETKQKLSRVIDNMTLINYATRRLDVFTTSYNHLVNFLPIFVLAQQYFTGLIEFGVIAQARQAFYHILDDLSVIVNQFQGIAQFMAGIDRLYLFMKAIQELDSDRPNEDATVMVAKDSIYEPVLTPPQDGIFVKTYDAFEPSAANTPVLKIRNLKLSTPDHKRTLIENLNLSIAKNQNLLIAGVSGAGKSSLLRAIAGLWTCGDGEIIRPSNVSFLPQKPYCPPGTLRDQLLYPGTELGDDYDLTIRNTTWSDEDLLNILTTVDLPHLASRSGDGDPIHGINAVLDWSNTLSLGEQQRLAFGRLLVNKPRLVVMDESTSALDVIAEKKMYALLKEQLVTDTGDPATYVSVGHRPTLLRYHDLKLLLQASGEAPVTSFISQETNSAEDQESILRA